MAWTIYKSSDGSAPTLSGTAGDMAKLLHKVLVAGYGAKSAAGWTMPYSDAVAPGDPPVEKAVFYAGASASARMYFRVLDDGSLSLGAKEASIVGYEAMSDVDTGTGPFPTVAQQANGMQLSKSNTADATTRPWIACADDRTCVLFVQTGASSDLWFGHYFGELYTYVPSDAYHAAVISQASGANLNSGHNFPYSANIDSHQGTFAADSTTYMARNYTGTGTAAACGKFLGTSMADIPVKGHLTQLNPADGGVYLTEMFVGTDQSGSNAIRGKLRGLWIPLHTGSGWTNGEAFDGTGTLTGKDFLWLFTKYNSGTGNIVLEVSDTVASS